MLLYLRYPLAALAIFLAWFASKAFTKYVQYKRVSRALKAQFPTVPVDSFLLGHASKGAYGSPQMHRWIATTATKYGKTFVMRIASRPVRPPEPLWG
jgi:hypothetical protein